jgi:hypothetical protein
MEETYFVYTEVRHGAVEKHKGYTERKTKREMQS